MIKYFDIIVFTYILFLKLLKVINFLFDDTTFDMILFYFFFIGHTQNRNIVSSITFNKFKKSTYVKIIKIIKVIIDTHKKIKFIL